MDRLVNSAVMEVGAYAVYGQDKNEFARFINSQCVYLSAELVMQSAKIIG